MHQKSDVESGLYYCDFRYYNPQWGRFISPDGIDYLDYDSVSGLNLYAYCNNNPVMYSDGDGHMPRWVKWLIGGAFIVAGLIATVATGGAFLPALAATAKAVAISTAVSAGIGAVVGGITTQSWSGVLDGLLDGAADGFMWGGIFAGSAQLLGSASKLLASKNVDFGKKFNYLFGNRNSQSTTLLRVNKNGKQLFRIDADVTHLWHLHFGKTSTLMRKHRELLVLLPYSGLTGILDSIF